MTGGKAEAINRGSLSCMIGETVEVDVIMNEVGVKRAMDANQPFSGMPRRFGLQHIKTLRGLFDIPQ